MAKLKKFNFQNVVQSNDVQSYEPIPEGSYVAVIEDSEERQTRAGNGSYLKLTWRIIDGPYQGRKVWENLNLDNPNEKAVEIAQRSLAEICVACRLQDVPEDSEVLHNKPMKIKITIREASNGYAASNDVRGHAYEQSGAVNVPSPTPF